MITARDELPARVKSAYAAGARRVGRALARLGVLPAKPPARDQRIRHWLYSLPRVHDSIALTDLDVPWWTYDAIDAVESWLSTRERPVRVFEYGSGASTVWLARRADTVFTVEHHRGFGEQFATVLSKFDNVHMQIVEPTRTRHPTVPSGKPGHGGLDFSDYVSAIDSVDGSFDLIVIDGRARQACLRAAIPRLNAGGLVVFDNSRRARYRPAINAGPLIERRLRGLTPTLPYPEQTSLLSN